MYTIGQVAEMFGLPVSTLRYYDKQGLFPGLERTSGIRRFGDTELEALRVIECLKKAGMEIKDIRLFMEWCAEGPSTYPKRKAMFEERKAHMESEIANMNRALDMLKFKCWYYEQAIQDGSEERTSGIRRFGDTELEALRVIECLKKAGMEIKDIRLFMEWCAEGPSTYPKRKAMFEERKAHMESEIANMNRALDMLKFKCWYYEQAIQDGSEDRVKALIPDNLPEEIKGAYENAHAR